MRNFFYLAIFCFLTMSASSLQAQRTVLIEEFTNASCGPCASQNPDFNILLEDNSFNVVAIKYQTVWPGFDPMNEQNPDQVATRVDYYGVTGVPVAAIDGTVPSPSYAGGVGTWTANYHGGPYGYNQAVLNYATALPSSMSVNISHSLSAANDTVMITVEVTNNDTVAYDNANAVLHTLILEEEIIFPWAPGSNGETEFTHIMRKMLPSDAGMALGAVAAGETKTFSFTEPMPEYIYDLSGVSTVAFVQDNATKAVLNADRSDAVDLNGNPPNLAITDKVTILADSYCDPAVTPGFEVTNTGDVEVTEFIAAYSLNGEDPYAINWTGSLAPGSSVEITFDEILVEQGQTQIDYGTQLDGDYNTLDNLVFPDFAIFIGSEGEEYDLNFEFEGLGFNELPDEHFTLLNEEGNLVTAISKEDAGLNYALGGFGESETSLLVDFYGILAGGENTILFTPEDFTNYDSLVLSFNWAYCQYTSENDRLEVLVSEDCGDTWTSVFDKAGADLATRGPLSSGRFFPRATEWADIAINMDDWAGADDVLIAFKTTSAYGNSLYLDDIQLARGAYVGVTELEGVSKFSVSPNPSNGNATLDLLVDRKLDGTVNVVNSTGRRVMNVFEGNVENVQLNMNLTSLPTGLYFVEVRTEEGIKMKKLNLIR